MLGSLPHMTHRVESATAEDEPHLLSLWNRCIGTDHPMTPRLMRQSLDGAARTTAMASLVVRAGPRPAGWVLARAYRPGSAPDAVPTLSSLHGAGGIGALCVDPDARGRGIGRALLDAAHRWFAGCAVDRASTAFGPYHFLPGVPETSPALARFFERNGWSAAPDCVDLDADLAEGNLPRPEPPPGVELRPVRDGEPVAAFVAREFPGVWAYIIHDFMDGGGDPRDVVVAARAGELLGFCQVHDERSLRLSGSTAWFPLLGASHGGLGPIGIADAARQKGLGFALLCAALSHQRDRGVRRMVIDWTTLVDFYGRAGFRVWRRYRPFRIRFDGMR
jgi:GNAT superfamily N-acetyltransferase